MNQRVTVDILNIGDMCNQAKANVHLRFLRNANGAPDNSYYAQVTDSSLTIMRLNNSWSGDRFITVSKTVNYQIDYSHVYTLVFTAIGNYPTTLTATLYDKTADNMEIVTVSATDSTEYLQDNGSVALGIYKNQAGQNTVNYDNFKYENVDELLCLDDFTREDGEVGNNWLLGVNADVSITDNKVNLKTSDLTTAQVERAVTSALMRPSSEARLNQLIEVDFERGPQVSGLHHRDIGAAIIARCQGEAPTASNAYRLESRLAFQSADGGAWWTEIYLYNTTQKISSDIIYVDPSHKYRLSLNVTSVSASQTDLVITLFDLTDNSQKYQKHVSDNDAVLQNVGTAGFSVYDEIGNSINVYRFNYVSTPNTIVYDEYNIIEAEAENVYSHLYDIRTEDNSTFAYQNNKGEITGIEELAVSLNQNSAYISFPVYVTTAGSYSVKVNYRLRADNNAEGWYAPIFVNGVVYKFESSSAIGSFGVSNELDIEFKQGINVIYCMAPTKDLADKLTNAYIDYDCIYVSKDVGTANGILSLQGDVNSDKVLDIRDLVRYKRYLADNNTSINKENADLDKDNPQINANDITKLRRYLVSVGGNDAEYNQLSYLSFNGNIKAEAANMLNNTYKKLVNDKKLNVAYFGGSITYGTGSTSPDTYSWRARTTKWLKEKFPSAEINETNAAIGGTGTSFGIYRMVDDLKLSSETERPDLVFIEFAINDLYDGITTDTAKTNLEYIIRTIYSYAPDTDIIMLFTTDEGQITKDFDMKVAHKEVAARFDLPNLDIGTMICEELMQDNGTIYPAWSSNFSDSVHPSNLGHEKYSKYVTNYIYSIFSSKTDIAEEYVDSYLPSDTLEDLPVNPYAANFKGQTNPNGWVFDENGHIKTYNTTPITFKFSGTDLKVWQWGQYNSCQLSVEIDGDEPILLELYREYTNHAIIDIVSGLENTEHTVTITPVQVDWTDKGGVYRNYVEIWNFLISGSDNRDGITLVN